MEEKAKREKNVSLSNIFLYLKFIRIAASTTSSNSYGLCSLYQQQYATINNELYSNNCITTTSSYSSNSSTVSSSFTTQRPQAIVTPMTATITVNEPVATVNQESKTKGMDDNKRKNNGMIPDIKNNNTPEKEEQKLNNQHCVQCSTAISQLNAISNNTSNYITSITTTGITGSTNTTGCSDSSSSNNFRNVLDHDITTMIDDSHPTIINSDLIETKKIETTNINNENSSFLTIIDHSIVSPTISQSCLSPVIEDSNSSGDRCYLTTDSISTIASISSSTGNSSASETTIRSIAQSDTVSSSIATSHVSSTKGERILPSSKSTSSISRSSGTTQPLTNRTITDKRHSVSTRSTNLHAIESLTKSKLATNTGTRAPRTVLHRSPINHTTISGIGSNVTTNSNIVENMRKVLENRLNITLPSGRSQLSASLADGVKLCNFANRIRLRAVNSLFTPVSEELPLSPPKCRRNVDSFLAACRRIGVPENSICSSADILERRNLPLLAKTVLALNKFCSSNANARTTATTTTTVTNATTTITTTAMTKTVVQPHAHTNV
ncbi:unnamed protein product [Cercopithifilaria johnstoni]|uniref:Calponin-homology (CH) domain-containing protein n=1 Tax=Cercopithifilaria johnstoni TaxID=2874296 RepID=A0A8J2M9X9_9BILA|nr:unnamed protein product [Cercopithifilaria johnstoni]